MVDTSEVDAVDVTEEEEKGQLDSNSGPSETHPAGRSVEDGGEPANFAAQTLVQGEEKPVQTELPGREGSRKRRGEHGEESGETPFGPRSVSHLPGEAHDSAERRSPAAVSSRPASVKLSFDEELRKRGIANDDDDDPDDQPGRFGPPLVSHEAHDSATRRDQSANSSKSTSVRLTFEEELSKRGIADDRDASPTEIPVRANYVEMDEHPVSLADIEDAKRYALYVQKYKEEEELRKQEEEEELKREMKNKKMQQAAATLVFLVLIIVVGIVAVRRSRGRTCSLGYYLQDSGSLLTRDTCVMCPYGMTAPAGSKGSEACYCRGGYYRSNTDGTGDCLPCDWGLWAPSAVSNGRITCQKYDLSWVLGNVSSSCEQTCQERGKEADVDSMRMWEGEYDAARSLNLAAFALGVNCSEYRMSFRTAGPFVCSEAGCEQLRGQCFHPGPPLQGEATWAAPDLIRRFCPCR